MRLWYPRLVEELLSDSRLWLRSPSDRFFLLGMTMAVPFRAVQCFPVFDQPLTSDMISQEAVAMRPVDPQLWKESQGSAERSP